MPRRFRNLRSATKLAKEVLYCDEESKGKKTHDHNHQDHRVCTPGPRLPRVVLSKTRPPELSCRPGSRPPVSVRQERVENRHRRQVAPGACVEGTGATGLVGPIWHRQNTSAQVYRILDAREETPSVSNPRRLSRHRRQIHVRSSAL